MAQVEASWFVTCNVYWNTEVIMYKSRINESFGVAHDTTNGAQIVLIGTDCHIAMAIIWKKTRRVEFV